MRQFAVLLLGLCVLGLTGCASVKESTPIRDEVVKKGLVVTRELPKRLPGKTHVVPGAQFVIVNADSTTLALADLLLNPLPVPIPGQDWVLGGAYNDQQAKKYRGVYDTVDPFVIATERLAGSPLLSQQADAIKLLPFVYIVEGSDSVWRASLVFRIDADDWLGRYMYHLPTTYTKAQLQQPDEVMLARLREEMVTGADTLRSLMERDAKGELKGDGRRATFGSYYLVGSRVGGLMPASLMVAREAQILEEDDSHVVLRSRGDIKADATEGALTFGVHYFRKEQLQTFKIEASK